MGHLDIVAREIIPANPTFGEDPNPDMPSPITDLYEEARAVAPISPRSAAGLLRVALENLLKDPPFNFTGKLYEMVGELEARPELQDFWEVVDIVRVIGNEAAHELRFRPGDGLDIVEQLQAILNELVEVEFTRPRKTKERLARVPANKKLPS